MNEITHSGIIMWVVGILGAMGGIISAIVLAIIRTLKGAVKDLDEKKESKELSNALHTQINEKLTEIKMGISDAKERVGTLREDLVEIKTILRHGQADETKRYDLHTEGWKKE